MYKCTLSRGFSASGSVGGEIALETHADDETRNTFNSLTFLIDASDRESVFDGELIKRPYKFSYCFHFHLLHCC